jgi:hypothetical protein
MTDDLLRWTRIRAEVEWASVPRVTPHPGTGIDTFVTSPNLRKALVQARSDTGKPLTFALMATWEAQFAASSFRDGPAFAKRGRERYGVGPDTLELFDRCLGQTTDPLPLAAVAARAYLDVCFFHPFPDGNGRAAMLALDFVLTRAGAGLRIAAPALMPARHVDADDALDYAHLIARLVQQVG